MSFVKIAKEFLMAVKGELDPYTTAKNEVKVKNFFTVELLTPAHIQFARYGRGPGKRPPINAILQWVQEKRITSPKDALGTAYAIANSISKKGTSNYVPNAPNFLEAMLEKHMANYLNKLNEEHLNKTNERHVQDMRTLFDEMEAQGGAFNIEFTPKGIK